MDSHGIVISGALVIVTAGPLACYSPFPTAPLPRHPAAMTRALLARTPHACLAAGRTFARRFGAGGAAFRGGGFFVFRQCLTCLTFQPLGGKAERGASFEAWSPHPRPLLVGEKSARPRPPSRGRAGGKMHRKSLAPARRERRPIPPFRPGCARFPWPGTRRGRRGKAGLRAALRPATRPSQSWR